jgi:hypothetical protein
MARRNRIAFYNTSSLLCGLWFMLTAWLWTYLMNLVISLPFGIIGMILWNKGRKADPNNKWNKIALAVHMAGLVVSIAAFIIFYFSN